MSTLISPNPYSLLLNPFNSNPKPQSLTIYKPSSAFSISHNPQRTLISIPRIKSRPSITASAATIANSSAAAFQPPTLKSRLHNGDTLYGMFLCSFSPTLAEIAGHSGYDFVVVDMEHGYGGIPEALTCLRALAATNTPAILRLPETTAMWAKKALDLGPQGIMFPMIDSPKEARKAVSYCRYPPNGVRGAAHPIVRASGYGVDAGGYLGSCEEDLLIMCQVEHEDAVDKVEDIAAVEGVDCIQMGPLDLSASMGYLWDPGNSKVADTLRKVEKAVLKSVATGSKDNKKGAFLAGFAMPHDSPQDLKSRGYQMVSGAVDIAMFRSAAVEDVNKFKLSLEISSDDDDVDGDHLTPDGKDSDDKYWSE